MDGETRHGVYTNLHAHFEAVPTIGEGDVNSFENLTPAIELYNTLIGMGRYEDAFIVFRDRLNDATLYRLSASRQRIEMLEMLFPDGTDNSPRLNNQSQQAFTLGALATAYDLNGQPGRAVPVQHKANEIDLGKGQEGSFAVGLANLSDTLRLNGALRKSEWAAYRALEIFRRLKDHFSEAVCLGILGLPLATRGEAEGSEQALRRSVGMLVKQNQQQSEGLGNAYLSQRAIWFGGYAEAFAFANRAWELAYVQKSERDFIKAARVHGEAALGMDDIVTADEWLHHALARARAVNFVEGELSALIALAELRRRQGDEKAALEFLDDVWEYAERGPYPQFHADALNVLAQIERDAGNIEAAKDAATKAYELAWCDGPPYAYHWGLEKAKKHLTELGVPFPDMPEFDETKFEPMPEVEIDPDDEFHVKDDG
jgi:tetratricopeptide (TPR) repeat protein